MSMNVRVKMEYPFPQNKYAFLVKEWLEVNDAESVFEADEEAWSALEAQQWKAAIAMGGVLCDVGQDVTVEKIETCWKAIKEISNLIRCYSEMCGVRGEEIGLKVLLDSLEEEC